MARVAVQVAGRLPDGAGRGDVLTTPSAFEPVAVVDVRLRGHGTPPDRPLLHVGAARVAVHARPLGEGFARLRLDHPLPLRHGDRAILRDPGSRALWGVEVVDAAPPELGRRGAARARASFLAVRRHDLQAEVEARGVVRRSLLRRLGVPDGPLPEGSIDERDWLVSRSRADEWCNRLGEAVRASADGISEAEAVRLLGLPEPTQLSALVAPPLSHRDGRVVASTGVPADLTDAMAALRGDLVAAPYGAPDAERLGELGLDRTSLARLARAGALLALGDGVVLLPGADDDAVRQLAGLAQPFRTSDARRALGTSRRVVLPLLAYLDRTGRTVRLPDDRRRVR
jgi:selenocysteine-specific elongation factor